MKKYKSILVPIMLLILCLFLITNYIINYYGTALYFFSISGEHNMGYVEAKKFATLSTSELLKIIEINKNYSKYPKTHYENSIMAGKYIGAINVLASKTDPKAIDRLIQIIYGDKEGDKWTAIGAIGRYKNKAMVPVLCNALKKHTNSHTDELIIKALVDINHPAALDCLIQEKDRIAYMSSHALVEKAIERWRTGSGK